MLEFLNTFAPHFLSRGVKGVPFEKSAYYVQLFRFNLLCDNNFAISD